MHNPTRRSGAHALLTAIILAAPLAAAGACATSPGEVFEVRPASGIDVRGPDRLRSLGDAVHEAFRGSRIPGSVVAVVLGDSVVFLEALTAEPLTAGAHMDPDALFPAAAAMPVVNALAAAAAARAGTVDLDRPVGPSLPELTDSLQDVTLAHLLTHRAGLVRHTALAGWRGDGLDAAERQLTYIDRMAPPGAIHSLAPAGVSLAGWYLQLKTGRPYARLVEATVLEPLGMLRSTVAFPGASSLTQGYQTTEFVGPRFVAVDPEPDSALGVPIHGLYSSASDLASLMRALLNDGMVGGEQRIPAQVVREALRVRARTPGRSGEEVTLAGRIQSWEGRRHLTFSKITAAHGMTLLLLPDDSLGVVVLANVPFRATKTIADTVVSHLLRVPSPRTRYSAPSFSPAPPVEPRLAEEVAGVYMNGGERLDLDVQGNRLRLRSGNMELEVRHSDGRYFAVLPDGRTALTFEIVHDGEGRDYIWLGDRALARTTRFP